MAAGADADAGEALRLRAQIMHSYLPPVDVELSIEFGGALNGQGDCRTIELHVSCQYTASMPGSCIKK
jgi:hypothetical protein